MTIYEDPASIHSVRTCPNCGGALTVMDTREQLRRPFTSNGYGVVLRERVCKGGTAGRVGDGCGFRSWSEEYVVASVTPNGKDEH